MTLRPEAAKPLSELAEVLLRGPSTLTQAERELIGTYVSSQNDCRYCQAIHGAVAAHSWRKRGAHLFSEKGFP
jgi:AhpD family alkylhydroperoxidase